MKQLKLTFLLTVLMSMVGAKVYAYDIAVENADGVTIYYNYTNDGKELEVTGTFALVNGSKENESYRNITIIVIPDEVTYMNRTRKVTSIGEEAFYNCYGLTSVTIPNSVTSIGDGAFRSCSGLTSVTIGNSVTSIGKKTFYYCTSLTSITIPNSVMSIGGSAFAYCNSLRKVIVSDIAAWCRINFGSNPLSYAKHLYSDENTEIKDLVIPNSVTSIGNEAFAYCRGLTSVTIGNNVTSIGEEAFYNCYGLTSVTIPNSVTSIGDGAFRSCSGLTSLTIPNSVTSIGDGAFRSCSGLTSLTIPNSVTSIGGGAFSGCSGLTSVTIGKNVTSIGGYAFDGWDLPVVISLIENPFSISNRTFSNNTLKNATLYVPKGTIDKYKVTEGWKDFAFIEEGTGGGETPSTPKTCEKPTISYNNGKLTFISSTEGATCQYSITNSDIKTGSGNEVQLGVTYTINVFAIKAGYDNSDIATAKLCWIDVAPKTEGITNEVAQVPAKAVLIQTNGGSINVQGCDDGEQVNVYNINGGQVGSAISQNGVATIDTSLQSGSIVIIKVGEKSVKIIMK